MVYGWTRRPAFGIGLDSMVFHWEITETGPLLYSRIASGIFRFISLLDLFYSPLFHVQTHVYTRFTFFFYYYQIGIMAGVAFLSGIFRASLGGVN